MLIAQISDTHIAPPGQMTCGVAPMAQNLAACVQSLNALPERPDIVVISGDLTQTGSAVEVAHAAEILSELACPWVVVPGNHDDRKTLWDALGGGPCPSREDGFLSFALPGHPLTIIGLDSTVPGQPGGALCPVRARWLRARLEEAEGAPVAIVLHHPPLHLGVPETDLDGFANAETLGEIVADFPNVERLLCGHVHFESHSRWHGSVVTTAPSPGMQLAFDPGQGAQSRFWLSPPAYLLHRWTEQGLLVTEPVRLETPDGPHAF